MADATATPQITDPQFLNDWERTTDGGTVHVFQETAGPYKKVQLFNFTFLGTTFTSQTYVGRADSGRGAIVEEHKGAGVCAELRDLLFRAQRRIYRSYAAEMSSTGGTPTESGFRAWCGVRVVSGWQFRSKQHSRGAAIDIDATFNPYVVTRTGAELGGEKHKDVSSTKLAELRERAMQVYANAYSLLYGEDLPDNQMSEAARTEPAGPAYDRFAAVHYALRAYFALGYLQTSKNRLRPTEVGFSRPFEPASEPGSFLFELERYRHLLKGVNKTPPRLLYDSIRKDYDLLRTAMVYGSLKPASPGFAGLGVQFPEGSRDPCHGFLSIRKEIAVGIREEGARWGAIDFGPQQNGDIMHFDLGSVQTATTTDPNEQKLLYNQKT